MSTAKRYARRCIGLEILMILKIFFIEDSLYQAWMEVTSFNL